MKVDDAIIGYQVDGNIRSVSLHFADRGDDKSGR
jgi:hypothetical protein